MEKGRVSQEVNAKFEALGDEIPYDRQKIGRVPMMLRSRYCALYGNDNNLTDYGECPYDQVPFYFYFSLFFIILFIYFYLFIYFLFYSIYLFLSILLIIFLFISFIILIFIIIIIIIIIIILYLNY